jgi:uncharacterized phage-associated protein
MVSARSVANFFIEKSIVENKPVDQLKLQKLVFYSFAWHIAHDRGELFDEDIYAWPHGPVVRELWEEFKHFWRLPINKLASETDWLSDPPKVVAPIVDETNVYEYRLLNNVWERYKSVSGITMSNMTHGPDEPWTIIRNQYPNIERPKIPSDLIKKKFKEKLKNSTPANGK